MAGAIALASPTPRPTAIPTPTARPTPTATPDPTKASKPTPDPKPASKPARGTRDLCDPILGFACALDAGTYEPSRFTPAIHFDLGAGWSTSVWTADLIVLGRQEGNLVLAGAITSVYPSGDATDPPRTAKDLVEVFIETNGVAAGRPADQRIDKKKATVVDLTTTGPDRLALFGTNTQTYYLEPNRTTRVIAMDGKDGPFAIAIEPGDGSTLEALLPAVATVLKNFSLR